MKTMALFIGIAILLTVASGSRSNAQDVNAGNAQKWSLSGLIQLQHSATADIESEADRTRHGFRVRTGRLQAKSQLNNYVSAKFQIEVRDNDPRLKDAEGKLKLFEHFFLRAGQFKVPVWREELRSSARLLLVERSAAASFLADQLLSARHVGIEFGGQFRNGVGFAFNYSNGAGEGGREDAGRSKSLSVNNGKLFSGRVNITAADMFQIALSAAANQLGNEINGMDNSGTVYTIAPDFGLYLDSGLDVEGGVAFGSVSKALFQIDENQDFLAADVTGRWHIPLTEPNPALAGMDGIELAIGISYVEPDSNIDDNEAFYFRFGPAFNFGKHTRIQINGEVEDPTMAGADPLFILRAQATFNF